MAVAQWVDATTNQTTVSAVGRVLERRLEWVKRKKIKIARARGPQISMAFSGWEDTTTNQKAALTLGYNIERQHAGL